MPARKGPKRVNRYLLELKRTAVRLSNAPGAKTMTDNAFVESFFHSMKSDVIHGHPQRTRVELESVVRRYIAHYNRTRLHSALAYRSPIDYERANA